MTSIPFGARQVSPGHAIPSPDMTAQLRASMILAFDLAPVAGWRELVNLAVIAHGGSLLAPNPCGWGPVEFELSLLQTFASGPTLEECVRSWLKHAARSVETSAA